MLFSSVFSTAADALLLAQTTAANGQSRNPLLDTLPMFFFIAVIFYFMLIRPQQKRAKDQATLISSMRSGDEVVTTGGLHGIIANPRETESKTVLVKFAENVKIEVDKSAITTVIKTDAAKPAKV